MTGEALAVVFVVMTIGAIIQGAVGFGMNLVAAPMLLLIDPTLIPGPILVAGLSLNAMMMVREREHGGLGSVGWALGGRVPGTIAATVALVMLSTDALATVFALLILAGCALSVGGLQIRRAPPTLVGAGLLSGFMGTAVGVGGPPLALVYQNETAAVLRGALARYFTVGGVISIGMLVGVGQFEPAALAASLLLIPGVIFGFLVSRRLNRLIDGAATRIAVLTLSAGSAIFVLGREVL